MSVNISEINIARLVLLSERFSVDTVGEKVEDLFPGITELLVAMKPDGDEKRYSIGDAQDSAISDFVTWATPETLLSLDFNEFSTRIQPFRQVGFSLTVSHLFGAAILDTTTFDGEINKSLLWFISEENEPTFHLETGATIPRLLSTASLNKPRFTMLLERQSVPGSWSAQLKARLKTDVDFLLKEFSLVELKTSYSQTMEYLKLCKSFVEDELPQHFELDRTTQLGLLTKASGYMKREATVNTRDFADEVFEQPEVVESFHAFKEQYQRDHEIEIDDEFEKSPAAAKASKKFVRSVLKLDKNFHIYVHGSRDLIESGFDAQRGLRFYKVFYTEET